MAEWHAHGKARKLWAWDASLWTGRDEGQWLGWLGVTNDQLAHVERLTAIKEAARTAGFSYVLLLGMGGSSLGPEVIKTTFGAISGFPEFFVLDSTDPAQVRSFEKKVDLKNTLFIVSSKSGSTLEPNVFKEYFFDHVERLIGPKEAGPHFLAITDPGSKMQQVAERDGFRRVFNEAHERVLQEVRLRVRDLRRVATCLEFGPRFLHSTGQAYKGGPNTGVFLQITCDDAVDLPVPGRRYTFGVVKAAQARGDFDVLVQRNRRALRVHFGTDVAAGLRRLRMSILTAPGS